MTLTTSLVEMNAKIVASLARVTILEKERAVTKSVKLSLRGENDRDNPRQNISYTYYYWTHDTASYHPSEKKQLETAVHQDIAIETARMGGGEREVKWIFTGPRNY